MNFKKEHTSPQNYYWWNKGFSKEELDKVHQGVSLLPFQEATTFASANDLIIKKEIRSSSIKWIPKTDEWQWLYEKLMRMAEEANSIWKFNLVSADESIQYTEYYDTAEGHYDWHQDIGPGSGSLRKISITVQLSEPNEYEGGEFEMWSGGKSIVTAEKGAGVVFMFPSYMMHRVKKITKGTRKSFVLWVGGDHYR